MGELCRAAVRTLLLYFQAVTGRELVPGVIAVIQTFGDRINLQPHLHFLVTEGGVDEKEGRVCYRDGKEAKELERMDYLEFIARVISLIPDKGQVTVRYYLLCKAQHKPYYAEFKIMLS